MNSASNETNAETRILGIDPGLNITGYGVISVPAMGRTPIVVEAGVVRSKRSDEFGARLASIFDGIDDVIKTLRPDAVAMEQLYSHYERPKTAIIMGHARGAICLAVQKNGLALQDYSATQVKKVLTGNGRAPKSQVQLAVARQLQLDEPPEPADVADALAIAICHHYLSLKPTSLT